MIDRCQKKDGLLTIEGSEGEGKTNSSAAIAGYIKDKTGRSINMYFRLKPLIEFAKKTTEKIIIWDEPALDSLSTNWWSETNQDLIRLLMTCRKKKHFFIFNFVKFYKFSEYVNVDRALGMIHMYSRGGVQSGRFIYVRKKNLEKLWNDYRSKKQRNYKKYMSFGGQMPLMDKYFDKLDITIENKPHCTLEDYEKLKDKAIDSIGSGKKKEADRYKILYDKLRYDVSQIQCPVKSKTELAQKLGIAKNTIFNWTKEFKETAQNTDKASNSNPLPSSYSIMGSFKDVSSKEETEDDEY